MKITPYLLAGLLAASCANAKDFSVGALTISQPMSHAMVPGAQVGDGLFSVTNSGSVADKLISASSNLADLMQLHKMIVENGIMKMGEVKGGLDIPAGQTVNLAPHYHLMFMDVKKPFKKGDHVQATLVFEKAGKVDVVFDVGKIAGPLTADEEGSTGTMKMQSMDMPGMDMSK